MPGLYIDFCQEMICNWLTSEMQRLTSLSTLLGTSLHSIICHGLAEMAVAIPLVGPTIPCIPCHALWRIVLLYDFFLGDNYIILEKFVML